jgi:hypothetical protein
MKVADRQSQITALEAQCKEAQQACSGAALMVNDLTASNQLWANGVAAALALLMGQEQQAPLEDCATAVASLTAAATGAKAAAATYRKGLQQAAKTLGRSSSSSSCSSSSLSKATADTEVKQLAVAAQGAVQIIEDLEAERLALMNEIEARLPHAWTKQQVVDAVTAAVAPGSGGLQHVIGSSAGSLPAQRPAAVGGDAVGGSNSMAESSNPAAPLAAATAAAAAGSGGGAAAVAHLEDAASAGTLEQEPMPAAPPPAAGAGAWSKVPSLNEHVEALGPHLKAAIACAVHHNHTAQKGSEVGQVAVAVGTKLYVAAVEQGKQLRAEQEPAMQELQGLLAAQPFSAPNFSHRAAILKRSGAVTGHMIFKMLEQYKQQQQQQQQAVVAEGQQQQQQ